MSAFFQINYSLLGAESRTEKHFRHFVKKVRGVSQIIVNGEKFARFCLYAVVHECALKDAAAAGLSDVTGITSCSSQLADIARRRTRGK